MVVQQIFWLMNDSIIIIIINVKIIVTLSQKCCRGTVQNVVKICS